MGWKDWPYWLKGGVIGLIAGIIDIIAALAFQAPTCEIGATCPQQHIIGKIALLLIYPLQILGKSIPTVITILIYFFIIGAIIGLIVGKVKK